MTSLGLSASYVLMDARADLCRHLIGSVDTMEDVSRHVQRTAHVRDRDRYEEDGDGECSRASVQRNLLPFLSE